MDQAIDTSVYTVPELDLRQYIKPRERPKCDYCSADAVVVIRYTVFDVLGGGKYTEVKEWDKPMCISHYDAFKFGTAIGINTDIEVEWL